MALVGTFSLDRRDRTAQGRPNHLLGTFGPPRVVARPATRWRCTGTRVSGHLEAGKVIGDLGVVVPVGQVVHDVDDSVDGGGEPDRDRDQ